MLAEKKLSLIVWDCYRPKRAVDDFLQWSKDGSGIFLRDGLDSKSVICPSGKSAGGTEI